MKFWNFFKNIVAFIGFSASIITIVLFINSRKDKIKVNVLYEDIEYLTEYNPASIEPELKSEYYFKGSKIDNLIRLKIKISNASSKTIVGKGLNRNILNDSIVLLYKDTLFQIIECKLIKSDFNHHFVFKNSYAVLNFEQWREDESIEYYLYIHQLKPENKLSFSFYEPTYRQIIDGDIFYFYSDEKQAAKSITDYIPNPVKKVFYILSLIVLGLSILILIIIIPSSIVAFFKRRQWYYLWGNDFLTFLNSNRNKLAKHKTVNEIYKDPSILFHHEWDGFVGIRYPSSSFDMKMDNSLSLFGVILIYILFLISIITVFIDLIVMFP